MQSLLSLFLAGAALAQAEGLKVCIEDRAGVGVPARAGLLRELHALLPKLDLEVADAGCNTLGDAGVLLSLRSERAGIPEDALGLAFRGNGEILPRLEVFVEPVVRLTRAGDWETVGRALARVAAHELMHYSRQSDQHATHGLMQARLSASELVSEDLRPRFVAALGHD
ncbi:MAG: hypothetical protein H6509_01420 [Bryobacterales bacterium]|nr:hypothetical protein [Bryobacterales bacterium]